MDSIKFSDKEIELAIACFKHTSTKPDFEEVGKELGITRSAAYFRHWSLMKKCGLAGTSGKGRKPSDGASPTPSTPASRKRGRTSKKNKEEELEEEAENNASEDCEQETPSKKAKVKVEKLEDGAAVSNGGGGTSAAAHKHSWM